MILVMKEMVEHDDYHGPHRKLKWFNYTWATQEINKYKEYIKIIYSNISRAIHRAF